MNADLIQKYFNGQATDQEKEEVLSFFKGKKLDSEHEEILRDWWNKYHPQDTYPKQAGEVLGRINTYIQTSERRAVRPLRWFKAAMAVALVFSMTFVIYHYRPLEKEPPIVHQVIKTTPLGTKQQIRLPDGSLIHLNSGSSIEYPKLFGRDLRKVILKGEAFFEIEKERQRPFVVECRGLKTTVLGTSFNISGYESEVVKVSLTSGTVKVDDQRDSTKSIYLTPGEQVICNIKHNSARIEMFDLHKVTSWRSGILIFDENDLSEIVQILTRWYAVDIQLSGVTDINQVKWKYSGEFDNESLENVLHGMSYVKEFDFIIKGKKVHILLNRKKNISNKHRNTDDMNSS